MIAPLTYELALYVAENMRAVDRALDLGEPATVAEGAMSRKGLSYAAMLPDGLPAAMFGAWQADDGLVWIWALMTERHAEVGRAYARLAKEVLVPGILASGRDVWALCRVDQHVHWRFLMWLGFRLDRLSRNHAGDGRDYFVVVRRA